MAKRRIRLLKNKAIGGGRDAMAGEIITVGDGEHVSEGMAYSWVCSHAAAYVDQEETPVSEPLSTRNVPPVATMGPTRKRSKR